MHVEVEICAGSLVSALAAQAGGADRIELCDNLSEGGTTPSPGIIMRAVSLLEIPVFVLIRPRPGDFLYNDEEFEAMKADIMFCKEHGVQGIVTGILNSDGTIDRIRMRELVELARPMQVTFHRAFDVCLDPFQALETIIGLGIERVLTSGQSPDAFTGAPVIARIIEKAGRRIEIMPGSGINEKNVKELLDITGAREIHASLRSPVSSRMNFRREQVAMGRPGDDQYTRMETDPDRVRGLISLLSIE